jgi:prolyl oligopeptidase
MCPRTYRLLVLMSFLLVVLGLTIGGCSTRQKTFPLTERHAVTDEYHGIQVTDEYRWLDSLKAPAVQAWNRAQNAYTRAYLDSLPILPEVQERLHRLYAEKAVQYSSLTYRKKLFALKLQPPKNQRLLVVFDSPDDFHSERVVVDPNALDVKGTTAIDWYVPSHDGKRVAVSLSKNGSEDGSLYVFEVSSGKQLQDIVPRAQYPTGGGSAAWNRDGTGLYYTRYPQGDERPKEDMNFYQQVYYHALGTAADADTYVIGKQFPKIAEIVLSSSDDGRYLLAAVANGDGGEFAHYLLGPEGSWAQITKFSDKIPSVVFGASDRLYLLSRAGAPRGQVLSLPLSSTSLDHARTVVPQSDAAIVTLHVGKTHLYVLDVLGGPCQIRVIDLAGLTQKSIGLRPISSASDLVVLRQDRLLFRTETFIDPPVWYRYDPAGGTTQTLALTASSGTSFPGVEVVREFATSNDGTKIPMNIIRRKGTVLNGNNATILYGYGGYGINQVPSFRLRRLVWLEQGGIYVVANLRGGGEFGEEWHEQGKLTSKQNVFDDFVACAKYLIQAGYTNPSRLAIEGGSNGGLLMGAVLTQHPELFRAVVSSVGIYDMLRVELFPNGAFNVTEFGTVTNADQFKALYAYSPYHHVVDGTAYPAVLFITGDNDGRVDPANSRKMTARLQAATSSDFPILLRTESKAGHGIGTGLSTQILQEADMLTFLFDQLGVQYKRVAED